MVCFDLGRSHKIEFLILSFLLILWFLFCLTGFVQFIDSMPVAEVLASDGSIQNFFRKHHPMESAPYGIQPEIIDNYVRSCGKTS